jgi:HK97 family phage portal protein
MALARLLSAARNPSVEARSSLTFDDYLRLMQNQFTFGGISYITPGGPFSELTAMQGAHNPIVAACVSCRLLVFAEARFMWQPWSAGRPGPLFGTQSLEILESPWPTASTVDLLARCEVDASLYGNSYWVKERGAFVNREILTRLDPTRVVIVDEMVNGYSRQLVGYAVTDEHSSQVIATFEPSEVAHYRPLPDPTHPFRGRSWLDAVLSDLTADTAMTDYKKTFLNNAATPNIVVSLEAGISPEAFETFVEKMKAQHGGAANAGKTLFMGGGADVKVVGANFDQLDFKSVQGGGETRVASAAGVPASIVGLAESLQGSSLTTGNYGAARRRFSDGTIRPLWRSVSGAFQTLIPPPRPGNRLWFDDRDIPFCQEDVKDSADIKAVESQAIRTLVDAGFEPESAVAAITTGDMSLLTHSNLYSVQLQPPGTVAALPAGETPAALPAAS